LTMACKAEEIAHKILASAKDLKLTSGRGPLGLAAAAAYLASVLTGDRKSPREIAEIAQVTEATLKKHVNMLTDRLLFTVSL